MAGVKKEPRGAGNEMKRKHSNERGGEKSGREDGKMEEGRYRPCPP